MPSLKPFYVYELRAKKNADSQVFYVGKGVGNRVSDHAKEVARKLQSSSSLDSRKEKMIAELINKETDGEIEELIIGRYNSDEEAEAVETTLINWIYGKNNLTNISSGRGSSYVRNKGDFDFDNQLNDTRTRKQQIEEKVKNLNLEEAAEELRANLKDYGITNTTKPAFIRAQDFVIQWTIPKTKFYLEFKLNMSDYAVVINGRANKGFDRHLVVLAEGAGYKVSKREYNDAFVPLAEFVKNTKYYDDGGNGKIKFGSYPKGVPLNQVEDIVKLVQDFVIRINLAGIRRMLSNDKYSAKDIQQLLDASIEVFKMRPEEKHPG